MASLSDSISSLSFLLQCRIEVPGHTARPGNQNYTQVCRLGSVEEVPTQGSEAGRRFQNIFLRRVAREYDEIKFVLLTYKRSYSHGNQSSAPECVSTPAFQTLCGVAREACMERILTQLMSVCSEGDSMGEDSLWRNLTNQEAGSRPSHDSRFLSALRHLTGCDAETAPLPEQLLPSLVRRLGESEIGTSALIRMVRAGCEQIQTVESLEKVAQRHQVVFPPVETLVSLQECSHIMAGQLIREVKERSAETGRFYSHSSSLSELLGYSILMPSVNKKYINNSCYIPIKSLPGYPRDFPRMLQNSAGLRQQNSEYTHKACKLAHAVLKKMLRNSDPRLKAAPLEWLGDAINCHQTLATAKFMKGREEQLVAHPGWRLNFCYVMLLFCEPFFSRTANQKLAGISEVYLASEGCRLDLPHEPCLARGVVLPRDPGPAQPSANFITEIFYLTMRALNLMLVSPMNQAIQVVSDLSKVSQTLPPESPERDLLEQLAGLTFISWDYSLLNEQLALMTSQFYVTAAIWLNMKIGATHIEDLSHVPELLIKDACQWFRFLVSSSPQLFRHLEMSPVIDLCVLLLQRQDLLPGPVAQSKLVSFLLSLVQSVPLGQLTNSWHSVQGELGTILHSNPTVRDQLGPALLTAYSAVDVVEGLDVDKDAFDKFSSRQDITSLLTHLWGRQDCRDSVLRQCDSPAFPTFLSSILDTLLYMLNDSLHRLRNARLVQLAMDGPAWVRLTPREQRGREEFLRSEERVTRGFLSLSQSALALLQLLAQSPDVARVLARPPLAHRTAAALIGFFESLCGSRAKEINVRRKENFRFDPKQLLRGLSQLTALVLSADVGPFYAALAAHQDLDPAALRRMGQLMREEGVPWADTCAQLAERLAGEQGTEGTEGAEEEGDMAWLSRGLDTELELELLTEAYKVSLEDSRYDSCPLVSCHALRGSLHPDTPSPARLKALLREASQLRESLPLHPDASIFARQDEERMDLVRALVTGPAGTPYAFGCFQFDCLFPQNFPAFPPLVKLCTTAAGTVRFNPNLYADGKVCLSLLGTWHGGDQSEKWDPKVSSLYQVLVSIQSIILIPEPLYNEPGYEGMRGTEEGDRRSRETNSELALHTLRHAMCDVIREPPEGFEEVVQIHFSLLKQPIMSQCAKWLQEAPSHQLRIRLVRAAKQLRDLLDSL